MHGIVAHFIHNWRFDGRVQYPKKYKIVARGHSLVPYFCFTSKDRAFYFRFWLKILYELNKNWIYRSEFWLSYIYKFLIYLIKNWWKGKPSGNIACTRKQQPRFYWSRSSVVMNDAEPLTPPSAKRNSIFKCKQHTCTLHDPWGQDKYDYTMM